MKLLLAVPSSKPKELPFKTLSWAPRAGFDLRIFTDPTVKKSKYRAAVEEANYQEFLDLRYSYVISGSNPLAYAQDNGYDLLAVVPPGLRTWNGNRNRDEMVIQFQTDLADARKRISSDKTLHEITFDNGTRVVRVVRLDK